MELSLSLSLHFPNAGYSCESALSSDTRYHKNGEKDIRMHIGDFTRDFGVRRTAINYVVVLIDWLMPVCVISQPGERKEEYPFERLIGTLRVDSRHRWETLRTWNSKPSSFFLSPSRSSDFTEPVLRFCRAIRYHLFAGCIIARIRGEGARSTGPLAFKTVSHIPTACPRYTRHDAGLAKRTQWWKLSRVHVRTWERGFARRQKKCLRNNNLQLSSGDPRQRGAALSLHDDHRRRRVALGEKTLLELSHAPQSVVTSALALIRAPARQRQLRDSAAGGITKFFDRPFRPSPRSWILIDVSARWRR